MLVPPKNSPWSILPPRTLARPKTRFPLELIMMKPPKLLFNALLLALTVLERINALLALLMSQISRNPLRLTPTTTPSSKPTNLITLHLLA